MGQKTNPIGLRIAVNKDWRSKWYANKKDFGALLAEDQKIRSILKKKLEAASVSRLGIETVPTATLCQGALLRSLASGIAVYDTLFVELAARRSCRLATFDKAVLKAFPVIAIRPRDLLRH